VNLNNAWTTLAAIASVVIPYLLIQTDVAVPPIVKVLLTAANLALVVIARTSNPNATPLQVAVTTPVAVTPVPPAADPPPQPKPEG
jgi:hypothetical protein